MCLHMGLRRFWGCRCGLHCQPFRVLVVAGRFRGLQCLLALHGFPAERWQPTVRTSGFKRTARQTSASLVKLSISRLPKSRVPRHANRIEIVVQSVQVTRNCSDFPGNDFSLACRRYCPSLVSSCREFSHCRYAVIAPEILEFHNSRNLMKIPVEKLAPTCTRR